jgi:hypothetical protein
VGDDKKEKKGKTLYLALPILSKSSPDVSEAATTVLTFVLHKGFDVHRVHTDRGKEFTSRTFRRICTQRGLRLTYTSGDEPQANGRAEAGVGIIKKGARVLLMSAPNANVTKADWPHAVRHFSFVRLMTCMGESMKAFPRFGSSIFTRIKAHDLRVSRHKEWLPIMISGVYLGQDYEGASGTIRIENGELRHGHCTPIPFAEDQFLQKTLDAIGWQVRRDPDGKRYFETSDGKVKQWNEPWLLELEVDVDGAIQAGDRRLRLRRKTGPQELRDILERRRLMSEGAPPQALAMPEVSGGMMESEGSVEPEDKTQIVYESDEEPPPSFKNGGNCKWEQ